MNKIFTRKRNGRRIGTAPDNLAFKLINEYSDLYINVSRFLYIHFLFIFSLPHKVTTNFIIEMLFLRKKSTFLNENERIIVVYSWMSIVN